MAKVHPQAPVSSTSCYFSSKQEVFTIWMKSLILSSNGCTVFDSNGQIVYRVDNYDHKCSDEVYLMDFRGQVLFTILKKKYKLFGEWEGYRSTVTKAKNRICPDFQVRRSLGFLRRESPCEVVAGLDKTQKFHCKIEKWNGKAACKIVDKLGGLIAEVKRKRSTGGVILGDDVLTMVVEPHFDHSLVMGLVTVFSLMNRRM